MARSPAPWLGIAAVSGGFVVSEVCMQICTNCLWLAGQKTQAIKDAVDADENANDDPTDTGLFELSQTRWDVVHIIESSKRDHDHVFHGVEFEVYP